MGGRPCCVILPRNHDPAKSEEAEMVRFALWTLEEGVRLATENGQDRVVVLYDRRGMTLSNYDRRLFSLAKQVVDIVQVCYAERLTAFYVMGANWLYWALYKVMQPFLSDVTKGKINLISDPSELLRHFERSQLDPALFEAVIAAADAVTGDKERELSVAARGEVAVEAFMRGQVAELQWRLAAYSVTLHCGFDTGQCSPQSDAAAKVLAELTTSPPAGEDGTSPPCHRDPTADEEAGDSAAVPETTATSAIPAIDGVPIPGSGRRIEATEGVQRTSFAAPADGILRLRWSNAHSRMRGKKITYSLRIVEPTDSS